LGRQFKRDCHYENQLPPSLKAVDFQWASFRTYSKEHWANFKQVFEGYIIDINKEESILLEQYISPKNVAGKIASKIFPKRTLNIDQYNALLKLKEQIIIKRQADRGSKWLKI
jgi:hypothetical protein